MRVLPAVLRRLISAPAAIGCGLAVLSPAALHAQTQADTACAATARAPSQDPRVAALVAEATAQHHAFGGQAIDTRGRLVQAGYQEAEFDRGDGDPVPTWRKVQRFWQALDPAEPRRVKASDSSTVDMPLLRQTVRGLSAARLQTFGSDAGLNARETAAIETSLARAAMVDNPWSAAFVSYMVRSAGIGSQEFVFSDAHAQYVDAAFLATAAEQAPAGSAPPTDAAYRACDIARTTPRPGDLLCHTRGPTAGIDRFASLQTALAERRRSLVPGGFAMHCDIVVGVDLAAAKVDSIGGNVLQSVTRRRMDLNGARPPVLSTQYAAGGDRLLNAQPWVVLLQYRK